MRGCGRKTESSGGQWGNRPGSAGTTLNVELVLTNPDTSGPAFPDVHLEQK